jgi:hypothetical protein
MAMFHAVELEDQHEATRLVDEAWENLLIIRKQLRVAQAGVVWIRIQ